MRTASFYFRMNDILGTIVKEGEVRDDQGRPANAMLEGSDITWNPESRNLKHRDVEHEYQHRALALAPETRSELSDILSGENFNKAIERRMNGLGLSRSEAAEEVYADLARTLPYTPDAIDRIERLAGNNMRLADRIYYGLKRLTADDTPTVTPSGDVFTRNELTAAQRIMEAGIAKASHNKSENGDQSVRYSFAGQKAKTADTSLLKKAQSMEQSGATPEEIWKETGWGKGLDGKWRFEIDDSNGEYSRWGFNPDILRQKELELKFLYGTISEAESAELAQLNNNLKGVAKPHRLEQVYRNDDLFSAYPFLKEVPVIYERTDNRGSYNPSTNTITINPSRTEQQQHSTLVHEIQHAVQHYEGLSSGSGSRDMNVYLNTAGEIESRDAAARRDLSAEQRRESFPESMKPRADVLFAEGGVSYDIVTLDNGKQYIEASRKVIKGNDLKSMRKDITSFFNSILKNGSIDIVATNGDVLTISKKITANKARDKHYYKNGIPIELTDDEFRVKLNAEAHIDELAEISKQNRRPRKDTKDHSFAKDGFTYRNAYFKDFDGRYYIVRLSIGQNNGVATVYNVTPKKDNLPTGNIVSRIGSKADGKLSLDYSISQPDSDVKSYSRDIPEDAAPPAGDKDNTSGKKPKRDPEFFIQRARLRKAALQRSNEIFDSIAPKPQNDEASSMTQPAPKAKSPVPKIRSPKLDAAIKNKPTISAPVSPTKIRSSDVQPEARSVTMEVSNSPSEVQAESGAQTQTATKVLSYGIIPSDEVRAFVRGKTTDKYWRDEGRMRAVGLVDDAIAELDGGEPELADEYLRQAADIVAEHTGVGDAAYSDFPAHITETFYNHLQTHLIEGLDPQSEAYRNEFKCSVTSLVTGYARDLGLPHTFDTEPIADKIREGYRASNINQGMVSLVDAAEMLAAAAGITDPDFVNNTAKQIQQYFINAQPAAEITPKKRADKDIAEFATNIELKFRNIAGYTFLSEGDVKAYADTVRRNVRELLGSDPDIRAIRDDINKSLTDQFYGKGYTEFEKETITRGVVNNIRALYTQRVAYMKQELDQFIWEQRAKKDYDPDNPSAEIQRAETAKRLLDEKSNVVVPLLEQFEGGFIYSKTFLNTLQNPFNLSKDEMNARSDEFLYQQESNKGQYTLARSEIMRTGIRQSIELLKSKAVWDGTDTIKSLILENWLGRIGCHKEAVGLMVVHADRNRTSGRQIQANAVAKHMTATGRVMKFEQELDQAYFEQYKYLKGQEGADRFRDRLAEARRLDDEQRANVARIMGEKSTVYRSLSSEAEGLQKNVIDWTDDISGVLLEAEQTAERINALEAKFPQKNSEPEKPSAAAVLAENAAISEDHAREHDSVVKIMRRAGASDEVIKALMDRHGGHLTAQDLADFDSFPEMAAELTPEDVDQTIAELSQLFNTLRALDVERARYEKQISDASARIAFLNDEMADRVNAALVKIQEGERIETIDYDDLPRANLSKLRTAEDKYLEHIGIPYFTTQERTQLRTTIFRIYDAKTPEDLIDTILDLSDRRHTAVQLKDRLMKNWVLKNSLFSDDSRNTSGGHAKGGLYKKLMRVYEDFGVKEDDVAKYGEGSDPKLDILKDIAIQQAFNSVTDRVKTSAAQKGRTAHFIAQLLGVPTFMGNILSEVLSGQVEGFTNNLATSLDIPVAAIQTIFQASTGKLKTDRNKKLNGNKVQRVVGYINTNRRFGYEVPVKGISKRLKAAAKRARESYLETALNVRLINRDRTALGKGTAYQRSFKKGVGASLERTLGYSLSVTDEHIKGYYAESVRQSLKNSGLTPEEIEQEAKLQADYRVFQNDTLIGKMLEDGRKVFNHIGLGPEDERGFKPFGLGDFITTYTLVPAAIFMRYLEYSPLGALKALYLFGHMYNKAYGIAKADVAPEPMIPAIPYAKMMTDPAPLNNETSYGPEDDPYRTSDNKHKKGENVFETIRKSFGNINDHDYRAFMLALSRGLTGTALISLGILLARLGIIMYSRKDSYNEEQLEKSKNTNGLVFNWSQAGRLIRGEADADKNHYGDTLMTFDWFAPVASNLSIGAEIYNKLGEDGIRLNSLDLWSETVKTSANVAPRFIENLSMWSSVNTLMHNWKNVNGDIPSLFAAEGADMAFSFMPSVLRQLSNAADDYQRDPYKASSVHELFWNKVRNNTPILRDGLKFNGNEYVEGLPYKIDSFGQVVETTTGNKALDFFNYSISPSKIRQYKDNDLADELTRLGEQDPGVVPTTPFREQKFDINGQEYKFSLSGKEYQEYAQMQGRLWYEAIHSFVDDPDYDRLSDSMKISVLNDIKSDVIYKAAREIWVGYQSGKGESELTKIENDLLKKYRNAASDKIKNIQATDYLNQEGVNTEDVIDAGYYEPYSEAEKKEQLAKWNETISNYSSYIVKINNGSFYSRDYGGYSRYWSAAKRAEKIKEYQDKIDSYQRSIEDVSSGAKQKWHKITGAFSSLTDQEKAAVISKMESQPDSIHLPDSVSNNKPDFSKAGPSVIDVSKPLVDWRNGSTIIGFDPTKWDTRRYDNGLRLEQDRLSQNNDAQSGDSGATTNDSVSGGNNTYGSFSRSYRGFKRYYKKRYYKKRKYKKRYYKKRKYKKRKYKRRSGGGSKRRSTVPYINSPSLGSLNNRTGGLARFANRFRGGGASRFSGGSAFGGTAAGKQGGGSSYSIPTIGGDMRSRGWRY